MKTIQINDQNIYIYIYIYIYFDHENIPLQYKIVNRISNFNRKNAYQIGLKSKMKLISILEEKKMFAKSFVNQPTNPEFGSYSFNDFEDRQIFKEQKMNYEKNKPIWDAYPNDLIICLKN